MRRKILKALSIVLSVMMVMTMSGIFAFADVTDTVVADGQSADPAKKDVTVNDNVTITDSSKYNSGVFVCQGGSVTVNGNVSVNYDSYSSGIHCSESDFTGSGSVSADGSETAVQSNKVTVNGNITSSGFEIYSFGESSNNIAVNGNIKSVEGGIYLTNFGGTNNISIDGNVDGGYAAADVSNFDGTSNIVCSGTMTGDTAIISYDTDAAHLNITTWGLRSSNSSKLVDVRDPVDLYVTANPYGDGLEAPEGLAKSEIEKQILANINYIIRKQANKGSFSIAGTDISSTTVNGKLYDTAKAGTHEIRITAKKGFKIRSIKSVTGTATVVKNSDGSYTLVIPDGGFVTLAATMVKKGSRAETVETFTAQPADRITTFDADGNKVTIVCPSSYEEFIKQLLSAIKNAPKNGKVEIATTSFSGIDKSVAEALKDRKDVSLEVRCDNSYEAGKIDLVKITVPAGECRTLLKLADKDTGKISFKIMAEEFETESITSIF